MLILHEQDIRKTRRALWALTRESLYERALFRVGYGASLSMRLMNYMEGRVPADFIYMNGPFFLCVACKYLW